jgi:hypothetical protein
MFAARSQRKVLALFGATLLALLGIEIGARLLECARGRPFGVGTLRDELENECRVLSKRAFLPGADKPGDKEEPGTRLLQPYTGWENVRTQSLILQDADYYARPESRAIYDVCVLGGSVAETFGELGAQRLRELLAADPRLAGRDVRVHDFGFGAYKQPQPATLLVYLLALGHEPDAVIELDGFNEAALTFSNAKLGGHPLYPYLAGWASAAQGLRPDWELGERMHEVRSAQDRASSFAEWLRDSGAWRSSFLAQLGLARVHALRRDYALAYKQLEQFLQTGSQEGHSAGPLFDPHPAAVAALAVRAWEQCALSLKGICAARGIDFLEVLQPTLHDEGSKPLTEKERANGGAGAEWIEGVKLVYPELRAAGARLAQRGVAFFDASGVFREHPEDIYVDVCHFREHGNEILAEAIAQAFRERALRK